MPTRSGRRYQTKMTLTNKFNLDNLKEALSSVDDINAHVQKRIEFENLGCGITPTLPVMVQISMCGNIHYQTSSKTCMSWIHTLAKQAKILIIQEITQFKSLFAKQFTKNSSHIQKVTTWLNRPPNFFKNAFNINYGPKPSSFSIE
ncbi:hypothetical protein O181_015286 [Austropuccinia psidii MF-1]|uniref:Uncharacterized protein n=1 Tax=Austropuccinia psidii MF-1 TaxID=1389203 RepID=A0A9Q3GPY9_9BASI|nr:hypothetical protein [Austropuccinia psidii MF-1]